MKSIYLVTLFLSCFHLSFGQTPTGQIVFSSRTNDSSSDELYSVNPDGTRLKKITRENNKSKDLPSVFGNRILYRQIEDKKSQRASLMITNIDGGETKTVLKNKAVCFPKWGHDGKMIAYEYYPGNGKSEIWVMDSNGSNNHRLISDARQPCWSYNNETMLFARDYDIWSFDIRNKTEQKIVSKKDTVTLFPALSPDGRELAYQGEFANTFGFFITDLRTGTIQKFIPHCGDISFWTGDPKYIVSCYLQPNKTPQICVIDVTTAKITPVTNSDNNNNSPCWITTSK